jgi:hypothetical protein
LPNPKSKIQNLKSQLLFLIIASWLGVMLLFIPLAYKVSMVDKHFFIAMPFMALACGALIDGALRRVARTGAEGAEGAEASPYRMVWAGVALLYVYLAAAAVQLWLARIVAVRQ